ncbi:MAG: hypothetical protein JOZ65_35240 [Chloroflexi bacterium]|nr:hypothetical protein [Chloroflexota bacterium]
MAAPEAFWARPSDTFGRPHEARAVSQAAPAAPVSVSPPLTIQRTTTSVMSPSSYATAAGTSSALSAAQQLTHAHTQGPQQPHMQGQAQPHMQGQGQAQPHMQWHGQGLPAVQRVQTDSGSASEQASGSVDAHALARQVYRILKHRLLLERERSGAWRSR